MVAVYVHIVHIKHFSIFTVDLLFCDVASTDAGTRLDELNAEPQGGIR